MECKARRASHEASSMKVKAISAPRSPCCHIRRRQQHHSALNLIIKKIRILHLTVLAEEARRARFLTVVLARAESISRNALNSSN